MLGEVGTNFWIMMKWRLLVVLAAFPCICGDDIGGMRGTTYETDMEEFGK